MTDVSFRIECPALPVDHSAALAQSLFSQQSWIAKLQGTGVHPIHLAGSQNGWQRPEGHSQLLLLSKRTRLRIRIEALQADRLIESLVGTVHTIAGYPLRVVDARVTPLQPATTLFSRYTVYLQDQQQQNEQAEQALMRRVVDNCNQFGFSPRKILCGRTATVLTADGSVTATSVLLADVPTEYSLVLQDNGLGDHRLMGCGILIPHKDTAAVH